MTKILRNNLNLVKQETGFMYCDLKFGISI